MYMLLSRELNEAKNRLEAHREYLRERLERGAEIQEGVHTAQLRPVFRVYHGENRADTLRLVVR